MEMRVSGQLPGQLPEFSREIVTGGCDTSTQDARDAQKPATGTRPKPWFCNTGSNVGVTRRVSISQKSSTPGSSS